MKLEQSTIQWLNLIYTSPVFVIRIGKVNESPNVLSPKTIPNNDGEYWVSGETVLKNGVKIPSVFRVDTDTGGTLLGVYWKIKDRWWDFQNRPTVFDELELTESEAFPFDWSYSVNLNEDIYHPSVIT